MSWQMLIWNMFIWSFTGLMIYFNSASMWWLILPTLFTGSTTARDLIVYNEMKEKQTDQEMLKTIEEIAKKNKIKL